ncbi:hypothetical protein BH11MYX4_BH11MYX4_40700 [soil metagenome]
MPRYAASPLETESRVGEVLASKYRLDELLGSGGMGHVYRAVNLDVGRAVAIKVLRLEHVQTQVVERFLREARAANLVRHPNVVDVLDIGREADGTPFIVQELLEGEDLARLMERRGGKLPLPEVVELLAPVIDAVGEAHAQGVIHRDIKPENVFLARTKRGIVPKLLDFGISKVSAPDLLVTEIGVMMGTPAYMPPEQVEGASTADARSDVWALGVMLFELITGRMPFEAPDAPSLFLAIATADAPTLLDVGAVVPPEISRVVARCLRRRPEERYPSAAELARDLRHVAEGTDLEPTAKRSIPPIARAQIPPLLTPATPHAPTLFDDTPPSVRLPATAPVPQGLGGSLSAGGSESLGQMHAVVTTHPRVTPPRSLPEPRVKSAEPEGTLSADASGIIGGAVVGLVVVLALGLLMQLVHRPEGWPVAHFVLHPGQALETALHGFLALLALVVGGANAWRGVRHWRGDLDGGSSHAVFNALVAAGAFFCAVELLSAVL